MKTLKTLLLLSLILLLFNCSDDDNKSNFEIDPDSLKQTSWGGTMNVSYYDGGEHTQSANIGIIFYTISDGKYDVKYDSSTEPYIYDFKYSIDEKILNIDGGPLGGNWLLVNVNAKQQTIVFERSTGGEYSEKSVLTLTKTH